MKKLFLMFCVIYSAFCLKLPNKLLLLITNNPNIEFFSNLITSNNGYINLFLPSLKTNEKQILFKSFPSRSLKIQSVPTKSTGNSINIYDFTSVKAIDVNSNYTKHLFSLNNNSKAYKILLINDTTSINELLNGTNLYPNRNYFIARFKTINGNTLVKLTRFYNLGLGPNLQLNEDYLLTWRPGDKINLNLITVKQRRLNFNGMKLPVAVVLKSPDGLPRLEDFRDHWSDTYTKANYGPVMMLFAYFNITPEFKVVKDYQHLKRDGNYILTVTAPYMIKELLEYIDFLKVTPPTKLCYTLRRPPTSFVTTIFTVTFTAGVWYAILGLLVILSIALYFFLNLETKRHDLKGKTFFNVYDLMLIGLEAICQQGTSTDPRSYAARMLQVFMFMAFMFIYVAYSANILVLLQSTTALKSRDQLSQYGVEFASMNASDYNYYNPETSTRIFEEHVNTSKLLSINDGMEKVRESVFAFYLESRYGAMYAKDYYSDYEICALQEFDEKYDFGMGYAGIGKNSGYTEIFKTALLQITEQGFANRHYLKYFFNPSCYSQGSSFDTIGIREIYQAIVLVAIGVLTGVFILILEFGLFRLKEKRNMANLIK